MPEQRGAQSARFTWSSHARRTAGLTDLPFILGISVPDRRLDRGRAGPIRRGGRISLASPVVQLLQRRWIAGHLLALFMAGLFVGLGVWQLARNTHKHQLVGPRKGRLRASPRPT